MGDMGDVAKGTDFATADLETRKKCELYRSADQTLTDTTETPISWDVELHDASGLHTAGSDDEFISLNEIGLWVVSFMASWATNSTGVRQIRIKHYGSSKVLFHTYSDRREASANTSFQTVSAMIEATATDHGVEATAQQNSGANRNLKGGTQDASSFSAVYWGGLP